MLGGTLRTGLITAADQTVHSCNSFSKKLLHYQELGIKNTSRMRSIFFMISSLFLILVTIFVFETYSTFLESPKCNFGTEAQHYSLPWSYRLFGSKLSRPLDTSALNHLGPSQFGPSHLGPQPSGPNGYFGS